MNDISQNSQDFRWWLWPSQLTDAFLSAGKSSPQSFSQPILPGWTFGNVISVTEQNSSAPDTERQIVSSQSYGRQLGRIMDALCVLIDELPRPATPAKAKVLDDFLKLRENIERIKTKAAAHRLENLRSDLATLKDNDRAQYRQLLAELKQIVGEENARA